MSRKIKWGVIGLGKIAGKFCEDIHLVPAAELFAVASRSLDNAKSFAQTHGAQVAYGDYQSIMQDSHVDVIYIATPHTLHAELTIQCLEAGKAVLCEKPFAMNASQVQRMVHAAEKNNVFLMEAMWTRFFPSTRHVLDLVHKGTIGKVRMVQADFGFTADYDVDKRLFNKTLGGGSLLDIGIYPLYLSMICMGTPEDIQASAHIGPTGVDHSLGMLLKYPGDAQAVLSATLTATTQTEAWVHGSEKSIHMHQRFHHCETLSIYQGHELESTIEFPHQGIGYHFEIQEVVDCLQAGKLESEKMTHQDSLNLISLLDQVREKIDLRYE